MKRLLALLLILPVLCGCAAGKPMQTTAPTTVSVTVPTTAAAPTTEPAAETTAEPTTEPTTVATEPPLVRHSGLEADGSFNEGTLFIGDSMTCILISDYLMPNGLLGGANYSAKYGAQVLAYLNGTRMEPHSYNRCFYRPEHEYMTYHEIAAQLGEQVNAVYIMFGTNFTEYQFVERYCEVVDYLLVTCPNATIHVQLIPWGNEQVVFYETVNGWLREVMAHYEALGEQRVMLIDTYTAIGQNTDEGCIHLNIQGNKHWYHAIRQHAADNGLVP